MVIFHSYVAVYQRVHILKISGGMKLRHCKPLPGAGLDAELKRLESAEEELRWWETRSKASEDMPCPFITIDITIYCNYSHWLFGANQNGTPNK